MGFVGTWVGQALIGSIGLLRTGVCALMLQAGSLALAAVIYRYRPTLLYSGTRHVCVSCVQIAYAVCISLCYTASAHLYGTQQIYLTTPFVLLLHNPAEACVILHKSRINPASTRISLDTNL